MASSRQLVLRDIPTANGIREEIGQVSKVGSLRENSTSQVDLEVAPALGALRLDQTTSRGDLQSQVLQGAHDFAIQSFTVNNTTTNYYRSPAPTTTQGQAEPIEPIEVIARWLGGPEFGGLYATMLGRRMAGTGIWFLETSEFRHLVQRKGATVWGTGMPASGKSVLSAIAINHLINTFADEKDVVIAYAFLRYTEQYETGQILASLLKQMVRANRVSHVETNRLYTRLAQQRIPLTEADILKTIRIIASSLAKVFIVIDGLDEAKEDVKDGLLDVLPSLGANLLIMSRPLHMYEDYVPDARSVRLQARTEDIETYVKGRIQKSARFRNALRGDGELIQNLCDTVKQKCDGMFLLAQLQMDALAVCNSAKSIFKVLESLPSGLDAMYHFILQRIEAQPAEDASVAYRVLLWVMQGANSDYRAGTVFANELPDLLAVSFEDQEYHPDEVRSVDSILSMCGGLVELTSDLALDTRDRRLRVTHNRTIFLHYYRFVHYTAFEFLKTLHFPGIPNPKTFCAVICTVGLHTYGAALILAWAENRGVTPRWPRQDIADIPRFITNTPFLCYVLENGWYHIRRSLDEGPLHPYIMAYLTGRETFLDFRHNQKELTLLTALHIAARLGLADLISSKVLPFKTMAFQDDETPIQYAVKHQSPSGLKALLENYTGGPAGYAADVNHKNRDGHTALILACQSTYRRDPGISVEIVELLASHPDIDVNLRSSDEKNVPAFWCACKSEEEDDTDSGAARTLISRCPTLCVDVADNEGNTAFMEACLSGYEDVVVWFLKRNNLDDPRFTRQVNRRGQTAFMRLCCEVPFQQRIAEHILAFDPDLDVNQKDSKGDTALMLSMNEEGRATRFLVSRFPNLDINAQDKLGMTALHIACYFRGPTTSLKALLDCRAFLDTGLHSQQGVSALHYACRPTFLLNNFDGPDYLELLLTSGKVRRETVFEVLLHPDIINPTRLAMSEARILLRCLIYLQKVEEEEGVVAVEDNQALVLLARHVVKGWKFELRLVLHYLRVLPLSSRASTPGRGTFSRLVNFLGRWTRR